MLRTQGRPALVRARSRAQVVDENRDLIDTLRAVVGRRHVLTGARKTRRYRTGFRHGAGAALAVVRPASLLELWDVLLLCVAADKIVIAQAANTGLTGGSTPFGGGYDREIVIISTLRISHVRLIAGGRQVICYAGASLFDLERELARIGREPHSTIGSSCIGASVVGGVCNNSGGSLIQRGPAYTEMALYARVDEFRCVRLVNHLGVRLGNDPRAALLRLDRGAFSDADLEFSGGARASNCDYLDKVRDVSADSPARFNADPGCLFEASGSAGKVMVFAVRLDTFAAELNSKVFYIGTNNAKELTDIRRQILSRFMVLPLEGEYIHRDAFDLAEQCGKDMFLAIRHLGTNRLAKLYAAKSLLDAVASRFRFLPDDLSEKLLQKIASLFPSHLPERLREYRDRFEHHLMLRVPSVGIAETRGFLTSHFPSVCGEYFECTAEEAGAAFLNRFVVAGAAVRYRAIHRRDVEDILALDVALRRNDDEWAEHLPTELEDPIVKKIYYGHFFCHVFHRDYIVRKGCDPDALENGLLALLDARGARYPAEHNVGHLYRADLVLMRHYRALDPSNCFNPGIGQSSKAAHWGDPVKLRCSSESSDRKAS